jgi:hypothetical protein
MGHGFEGGEEEQCEGVDVRVEVAAFGGEGLEREAGEQEPVRAMETLDRRFERPAQIGSATCVVDVAMGEHDLLDE